jgi:putative ABC transport system permease protein
LVSLQTVEQILLTERIGTPTGGLSEYPAYFLDADAPNHTAAVAAEVKKRGFSPDYLEAQLQGLSERILGIQALVGILVLLILVFAGLSIVNTLSQAVRQRRRELGVLAALGFGRLWIGSLVAMEAVITSAIGGVLGVALAFAITEAFRFVVPTLQVSIPLLDVAVVLAGVFPFAAAAALAPVLLVNRLDPVEVLRNE